MYSRKVGDKKRGKAPVVTYRKSLRTKFYSEEVIITLAEAESFGLDYVPTIFVGDAETGGCAKQAYLNADGSKLVKAHLECTETYWVTDRRLDYPGKRSDRYYRRDDFRPTKWDREEVIELYDADPVINVYVTEEFSCYVEYTGDGVEVVELELHPRARCLALSL